MLHFPAVNAVLGQIVRCDNGITLLDWISASYHELHIQVEFPWPPAGLKAVMNYFFLCESIGRCSVLCFWLSLLMFLIEFID